MISLPDTSTLLPAACYPLSATGGRLHVLPSTSTELVRLDLLHEAGSAYQPQMLCSAAANRLFTLASDTMDSCEVAEFMDYRGIIVEHNPDTFTCTTTFYLLRRYLDELLPVVKGLLERPAFPQDDFEVFRNKRRQELQALQLKSGEVARRLFYQTLFGQDHPLGRYAAPEDADRLDRDTVLRYYQERYTTMDMVLSGNIDQEAIEMVSSLSSSTSLTSSTRTTSLSSLAQPVSGAVQTTLRVGRILPLAWDSMDYARFMLLTTLLGGYFGSRLMSNLREDKGFTYGIHARTQIYRGVIVFYINTDVAAGTADAAEEEIRHELRRLCEEAVGEEELLMVKNVLVGDFIRSVDGIFERAERLCSMLATDVNETFTDNLRQALQETTPSQLQELAQRMLRPDAMLFCRAGVI